MPARPSRSPALAVAVVALAVVALTGATASAASPTRLTVTYWEDGHVPGTRVVWTLRCDPVGGTHPSPVRPCRLLARRGAALFAPTPKDAACAQLYGGPQTALVRGTVAGRRIWARFHRADGCGIDRWQRVAPLLPTTFER